MSKYMHALCEEHLEAVSWILKYLKTTPGKVLFSGKLEKRILETFIDIDLVGSIGDNQLQDTVPLWHEEVGSNQWLLEVVLWLSLEQWL